MRGGLNYFRCHRQANSVKISFINSDEKIGGIRDRQGTHGDVGFSGLALAAADKDDGDEAADVVLTGEPQATANSTVITAGRPQKEAERASRSHWYSPAD